MKYIILLHGFGSNSLFMTPLAKRLKNDFPDFTIINKSYNTFTHHYFKLLTTIHNDMKTLVTTPSEIVVIGHSLGGILATDLICCFPDIDVKCVILGAPFRGALLADIINVFVPVAKKMFPIVEYLTKEPDGIHVLPNNTHKFLIVHATKRLTWYNPITWITGILLFGQKLHDGVVDFTLADLDDIEHKDVFIVDVDHINLIFNKRIYNIIELFLRDSNEINSHNRKQFSNSFRQ